jgi:hypothetical protein
MVTGIPRIQYGPADDLHQMLYGEFGSDSYQSSMRS